MTAKAAADKPLRKLPNVSENATAEASAQAEAYESIFSPSPLELDGGEVMMIPPHPDYGMLDDDRMEEWDELLFAIDNEYLRDPDIIVPDHELKDKDGNPTGVTVPGETIRGQLRRPFQRLVDGKPALVKPPHTVKIVQVALGEAEFKRLKDGGRNASDVWKVWGEQSIRIQERQQRDPKSARGTVAVAPVPPSDS